MKIRDTICFTKIELEEVEELIKNKNENSEKFEKVKEKIPKFYSMAKKLDEDNKILKEDNVYLWSMLSKIYYADKSENKVEKDLLFRELKLK